MLTRVAVGRARVVREVRAAAPLMTALRAPVPSRAPWLTAVLNAGPWRSAAAPVGRRPVAVVVEPHPLGRPAAVAFLELHRIGAVTTVRLLGQDTEPLPPGRPPLRLLARDDEVAGRLATGIIDLLTRLRGSWTLRLAGLPMGDPTLRVLASELPGSMLANERSVALIDGLDEVGAASSPIRSRDPRVVERWLPALMDREPDGRARGFLRAATRLHAAMDQVELAVAARGDRVDAALLTLVDGPDRWPWWGFGRGAGTTVPGSPLVCLTASGGLRPPPLPYSATAVAWSSRLPGWVTRRRQPFARG